MFIVIFLLLSAAATEAFVTPPRMPVLSTNPTTLILCETASSNSNVDARGNNNNYDDHLNDNEALKKLQHEYRILQERLYADLVLKHDEEDAELVEEQMLEIATSATKIHEHKQMEIIHDAERRHLQAMEVRKRAEALREDEVGLDATMVNEMEAAYDDLVRYSDFKDLEAQDKLEAAKTLLDELTENETRLRATLLALKEEKGKNVALEEELHAQHRSFLDKVKDAIYAHPDIIISLDPHIL